MLKHSFYSILVLHYFFPYPSIADFNDVHIVYNGVISGKFVCNSCAVMSCSDNGTYYFSDLTESSLVVGSTGPDSGPDSGSSPFFLDLKHFGRSWTEGRRSKRRSLTEGFSKRGICLNPIGGCTYDAVYNLDFDTRGYVNLSAAVVTRVINVPISDQDRGPFYDVRGDENTWIDYLDPQFNFQIPRNYSSELPHCVNETEFSWNSSRFTYDISFTNTTGVALLTLSGIAGNITISFAGTSGNNSSFVLGPLLNYSLPYFTFANGSEIAWQPDAAGEWLPIVSSSAGKEVLSWGKLRWAMFGGISLVLFS